MMNIIEKETGAIVIDCTTKICVGDSLKKALDIVSSLSETTKVDDMKTGYVWLRTANSKIEDFYFCFGFCFMNDQLESINFAVSESPIHNTWDNWSEENELRKMEMYRNWLLKDLGRTGTFSWGTVDALYDKKGGGSHILLRYKQQET